MNTFRRTKKSKGTLLKIVTSEDTPEQQAKQKLIELSNIWDYQQAQSNFNDNPQAILEEPHSKKQTSTPRVGFNTERKHSNLQTDFKRLTELLEEKPEVERLQIRSERHYKYGDKFISIALRNPLITSNYVVTGVNHEHTQSSQPPRSQYVIRQQRNQSRIKRQQVLRAESYLRQKLEDESFLGKKNQMVKFCTAKSSNLYSFLKSQEFKGTKSEAPINKLENSRRKSEYLNKKK